MKILDAHSTKHSVFRLEEEVRNAHLLTPIIMRPLCATECTRAANDSSEYSLSVHSRLIMLQVTKATIDVIGKVVCDHDFRSLTSNNDFLDTMRTALAWIPDQTSINPLHTYNPIRPLMSRYCKWKMDKYIGGMLDERFTIRDIATSQRLRKKTGIDLALEKYYKDKGQDVDAQNVSMDAEFRQAAIDNLLILLFAGHDTTASTLCYW